MPRILIIFLAIFIFYGLLYYCDRLKYELAVSPSENKIDSDKLIQDLEILKECILKAHGDPFRFTTKGSLMKHFAKTKAILRKTEGMSRKRFCGLIFPIIAELRDGHSSVLLPNELKYDNIFPVEFIFYQNKPYVTRNFSQSFVPINSQIIEINNIKMEKLIDSFLKVMNKDGNIYTACYRRLEDLSYFTGLLKVFNHSSRFYNIKVKTPDGNIQTYKIESISWGKLNERKTYLSTKKYIGLKLVDSLKHIAILKIPSFSGTKLRLKPEDVKRKIDNVMATVLRLNIQRLIIDVRDNTGGDTGYVLHLLRYLMKEKFQMFSSITFKHNDYRFLPLDNVWDIKKKLFHLNKDSTYIYESTRSTLGEFEPFDKSYKGEIVVLINGWTFSAAAIFSAQLHHAKRSVFIGEETGGSYVGTVAGFPLILRLPNSQLRVVLSPMNSKNHFYDTHWTDRGVMPDIPLESSVDDRLNAIDVVLEKAISIQ